MSSAPQSTYLGSRIIQKIAKLIVFTFLISASVTILGPQFANAAAPGDFDPSFNHSPEILFPTAGGSYDLIALDSADRAMLVGNYWDSVVGLQGIKVSRRLPNGLLDRSFGVNGYAYETATANGSQVEIQEETVKLGTDGSIYIAFLENPHSNPPTGFGVMKLTSAGRLDSNFGASGIYSNTSFPAGVIYGLAIDSSNGLIAGGTYSPDGSMIVYNNLLLRLNNLGSLDSSFGNQGFETTTPSGGGSQINSVDVSKYFKMLSFCW